MKQSNQNEKLIASFKEQLETLGYKKGTVKMLPNLLQDFLEFTDKKTEKIKAKQILAYYKHLKERPNKRSIGALSESYINHHLYSLKLFFGWQQQLGKIKKNPISGLDFPRPKSKPRITLTKTEIEQLYKACKNYKERSLLGLFYGCGLRRSEAEKLELKDINFNDSLLYVRLGKANKRRVVPVSREVLQDFKAYRNRERKANLAVDSFITNRIGNKISGNSCNAIIKKLANDAGIEKQISLHCLRHSIAGHLLENGLSTEYVRDFLGHKHLEATQIYLKVKDSQLWNLSNT